MEKVVKSEIKIGLDWLAFYGSWPCV